MKEREQSLETLLHALPVWVLVMSIQNETILYRNQEYAEFERKNPGMEEIVIQRLKESWNRETGAFEPCILEHAYDRQDTQERKVWKTVLSAKKIEWMGIPAAVFCAWDVTEEFSRRMFLEKESHTDDLTGLYNRRYCRKTIQRCLDCRTPFSIGFIDMDHLKMVNDCFGHEEGDCYIRIVADLLRESFRSGDVICRYGGDEFVVILEHCDENMAREKLLAVQDRLRMWNHARAYAMGICFGVEEVRQVMQREADQILNCADRKMYQMKTLSGVASDDR